MNDNAGGHIIDDSIPIPDGQVVRKKLHFFWIADCSDSMRGKKIATLNQAIREAVPEVQKAVASYPQVEIVMRAIKFSDAASWHVGPDPVPLEQFVWPELETSGLTATAKALRMLETELSIERMPRRGLPPVCILVSDGFCTDPREEYDSAIADLARIPWGVKAVRLAIAIGDESDYNEPELLKFVNQDQIGLLKAHSPEELVSYIKWASVSASVASSRGRSRGTGAVDETSNVTIDSPPPLITSNTELF
ncbi:tellurium resistance protein [Methanoregula sp.]|uniref:vWA domain-containing protein n=1 Tax=Methanoregula sp. TaxID=2052170 RepID=UPI00356A10CE